MPTELQPAVLHLTAAPGGGVDRYIRDLASSTSRRHLIWHIGTGIGVVEDVAAHRFLPLRDLTQVQHGPAMLCRWLRSNGVGVVHVHGLGAACRDHLAMLEPAALRYIVTLHDLMFINPNAFDVPGMPAPDTAWIAGLAGTLERAAAVIAPSVFIRDVASLGFPGLNVSVIPPGFSAQPQALRAQARIDDAARARRHVVGIVGAIGPHKGSGLLDALAAALEGSDIELVVIGYTDSQLIRGWRLENRLYVHGPYVDDELTSLLDAYGVDIALFPNRLPESFSYTLSEVWAAGVPVIVPDEGALGERVAACGGGWRLPPGFAADDAANLLSRLFSEGGAPERTRVKSLLSPIDPKRIPPLDAMARDIDALYARFALPPPASASNPSLGQDALAPLLAANLDGFAFRSELLLLADELAQARAADTEAKGRIAKLEENATALSRQLTEQTEEIRRLALEKAAFDLLPRFVHKILHWKLRHGRRRR